MNELQIQENGFLDGMDKEQQDQLFSIMLAKKQVRTEQSIKQLFDLVKKQKEVLSQEIETVKLDSKRIMEDAERQLELERKRHRVTESRFGFVTLRDLGAKYAVTIGNQKMAKLLKAAGLAIRKVDSNNTGHTTPKMEYIRNGTAVSETYEGRDAYKWNPKKTIKKIDRWLDKNGYIDQFYAYENQDELYKFIEKLYSVHVGDGH